MSAGRVRGLVAASFAALVPVAGTAAASHLASPMVQLPAPAEVGQAAHTAAVIETTIDDGPVSLQLETSSTVTEVAVNGSYTTHSTIDALAVTNAPASADVRSWGLDELQGMGYDRRYSATGIPLTMVTRAVNPQSFVLDSVSMVYVGFPDRPIDVGDSWTVDGRIASDGMTFDVTYQCRLATVADGAYTVDISYAEGFTSPVEGGVAEGTISGTGTLGGSLANPLVVWGGINQTIDGVVTIGNVATTMRRDTSVTLDSSGR